MTLQEQLDEARREIKQLHSAHIHMVQEIMDLESKLAAYEGQTRWQCQCGGTDCEGQRENERLRELCRRSYEVILNDLEENGYAIHLERLADDLNAALHTNTATVSEQREG